MERVTRRSSLNNTHKNEILKRIKGWFIEFKMIKNRIDALKGLKGKMETFKVSYGHWGSAVFSDYIGRKVKL